MKSSVGATGKLKSVMYTPICFPQPKFAFPRSYAIEFGMSADGFPVTQIDNLWRIDYGSPVSVLVYARMRENVFEWSSNVYTLDYVWDDLWYTLPPDPTPLPYLANFVWATNPNTGVKVLLLDPTHLGSVAELFPLPPSPTGWWSG